jgi:Holliday junction DNA helicase RuvB
LAFDQPAARRFGIPVRLNFYSVEELEQIVRRGAHPLPCRLGTMARWRSPGARAARAHCRRLLRRVRDFASVAGDGHVDRQIADEALTRLEVDALGLDALDRRYLSMIARNFGGGPVGIETIAAGLSEPRDAIEDIIEPYLIQQGFIQRTPRGRVLTANAWRHLGLDPPKDLAQQQISLFQDE